MGQPVVGVGEKVHIITRRNFADDLRRHFAGVVVGVSETAVRVEGFAFVFNSSTNEFAKRPETRTRVFSLIDAANVINVIGQDVDIAALKYRTIERRLKVTDDAGFALDINEFGPST